MPREHVAIRNFHWKWRNEKFRSVSTLFSVFILRTFHLARVERAAPDCVLLWFRVHDQNNLLLLFILTGSLIFFKQLQPQKSFGLITNYCHYFNPLFFEVFRYSSRLRFLSTIFFSLLNRTQLQRRHAENRFVFRWWCQLMFSCRSVSVDGTFSCLQWIFVYSLHKLWFDSSLKIAFFLIGLWTLCG